MKIKLSELKRIIRSEVRRAKKLNEQGRPSTSEYATPAYDADEFIDYVTAGFSKSKRGLGALQPGRASVKAPGAGRPQEFHVDTPEVGMVVMSDRELVDAYNPGGSKGYDVYDTDGTYMASVPLEADFEELVTRRAA
jgi:hypothetical protein